MTKTVYRYFFDFVEGQEKWLNHMAAKGYRLVRCGKVRYDFERCRPGEYEYAVDFVGDKPWTKINDYKSFLESLGYRTFSKNANWNLNLVKARWRPWAKGMGQLATSPGGFNKELLIVEKQRDGKPFHLHTDTGDLLNSYRTLRNAYLWGTFPLLVLVVLAVAKLLQDANQGLSPSEIRFWLTAFLTALVAGCCVPLVKCIIKYARRVRRLKSERAPFE